MYTFHHSNFHVCTERMFMSKGSSEFVSERREELALDVFKAKGQGKCVPVPVAVFQLYARKLWL